MIIKLISEIIFWGLMLLFGLFGFAMIFSLLKYGKSLILGLAVSAVFLIIMFSLFGAAVVNFNNINFPNF